MEQPARGEIQSEQLATLFANDSPTASARAALPTGESDKHSRSGSDNLSDASKKKPRVMPDSWQYLTFPRHAGS